MAKKLLLIMKSWPVTDLWTASDFDSPPSCYCSCWPELQQSYPLIISSDGFCDYVLVGRHMSEGKKKSPHDRYKIWVYVLYKRYIHVYSTLYMYYRSIFYNTAKWVEVYSELIIWFALNSQLATSYIKLKQFVDKALHFQPWHSHICNNWKN